MSTEPVPNPLGDRLVSWMSEHRADLEALMTQEASRAVHLEFIAAEGGDLPDRAARLRRAREASIRAWLRHLMRATAAVVPRAPAELVVEMERYCATHQERREAFELEEEAFLERFGRSADPDADRRDIGLAGHTTLFAEALAASSPCAGERTPPEFAREVGRRNRLEARRRRRVEAQARREWQRQTPTENVETAGTRPESDQVRVAQAAAVWAHVLVLTETLGHLLDEPQEPAAADAG